MTNTSSTYIGRPVRVVSEVDRVNETRLEKRPEVKKSFFLCIVTLFALLSLHYYLLNLLGKFKISFLKDLT